MPSGSDLREFDSAVWIDEESILSIKRPDGGKKRISEREMMLSDLVNNVLPGKNRSQIEALLGPSLDTPYFREMDKDLIYRIGPQRSGPFQLDSEWLLIWLDDRGEYERFRIVND